MQRKALITGITGQDGAYLAHFLLAKGYDVHGVIRRSSSDNTQKLSSFLESKKKSLQNLSLHFGDLCDSSSLETIINSVQPDEIYNLAAQSHVGVSFENPLYTANVDGLGTLRILEAMRKNKKNIKFYQASTSELFGKVHEIPQTEMTQFYPRSPYAVAKLFAYWITVNYRESYGMFACNGILFNHESPLRSENFVTRKITLGLARIKSGLQEKLSLGNLDAKRDWGHAENYVEAMWLMLQKNVATDYVIASGKQHSVRDFITLVASKYGMKIAWDGTGLEEKGYEISGDKPKLIIDVDKNLFRPAEVDTLLGNAAKAREELGWDASNDIGSLITEMTDAELKLISHSKIGGTSES